MYIKERREIAEEQAKDKNFKWSELNKFENLKILDDKGQSLILEGSLTGQMVGKKRKTVSYAIKILPLTIEKGCEDKVTPILEKMRAWNNLGRHENVLKPSRIWSESIKSKEQATEYKNKLGITSHKEWLKLNKDNFLEILIWEMDHCRLDLRLFFRFNNTPTSSDRMAIFLQIVSGVHFFHTHLGQEGHGNLCPEAILLLEQTEASEDAAAAGPKIRIANKSSHKNRFSNLYKAIEFQDEEIAEEHDDKKPNDIFALGMILFELFCPGAQRDLFITGTNVGRRIYPAGFAVKWPRVLDIVEVLLFSGHAERPTANQLLLGLLDNEEFRVDGAFCMNIGKDSGQGWIKRVKEKEARFKEKLEMEETAAIKKDEVIQEQNRIEQEHKDNKVRLDAVTARRLEGSSKSKKKEKPAPETVEAKDGDKAEKPKTLLRKATSFKILKSEGDKTTKAKVEKNKAIAEIPPSCEDAEETVAMETKENAKTKSSFFGNPFFKKKEKSGHQVESEVNDINPEDDWQTTVSSLEEFEDDGKQDVAALNQKKKKSGWSKLSSLLNPLGKSDSTPVPVKQSDDNSMTEEDTKDDPIEETPTVEPHSEPDSVEEDQALVDKDDSENESATSAHEQDKETHGEE